MHKPVLICYFSLLISILSLPVDSYSQNVGVGTNTPHAKAILEIKSTDKGVLFPRLTTAQRNVIVSPPDGLHIFNTDERCLNYYDSTNQIWNCYCNGCQTIVITIASNMCTVDFNAMYASISPSKKYLINILAGVVISGCDPGDTALSFNNIPYNEDITINNYGTIAGGGGKGGNGAINRGCMFLDVVAAPGQNGGFAISTRDGIPVTINNYGVVAGGGGGGGGSSGVNTTSSWGGGGGGGAGIVTGSGGTAGGLFVSSGAPISACVGLISYLGQNGVAGLTTTGGSGGAGAGGGFSGGNGGGRGQAGQNGAGLIATIASGGAAGKAIGGGTDNSILNISGGQTYGHVD
ncbi:MAG: hypothetical protein IPK57_02840 [Chitinophagaceae bacterium]|nr:hypothetical protein [Chitinophagaceae bacterium]